jgi:hypothetical protein
MRFILGIVRWLWWLCVAGLPFGIFWAESEYRAAIACPPSGDCYVDGSSGLIAVQTVAVVAVALLWPVCGWFLVIAPLRALFGRPQSN